MLLGSDSKGKRNASKKTVPWSPPHASWLMAQSWHLLQPRTFRVKSISDPLRRDGSAVLRHQCPISRAGYRTSAVQLRHARNAWVILALNTFLLCLSEQKALWGARVRNRSAVSLFNCKCNHATRGASHARTRAEQTCCVPFSTASVNDCHSEAHTRRRGQTRSLNTFPVPPLEQKGSSEGSPTGQKPRRSCGRDCLCGEEHREQLLRALNSKCL